MCLRKTGCVRRDYVARKSAGTPYISAVPQNPQPACKRAGEVEMEGRHGEEMSESEREENATAQGEELEALEAIYGECCETGRSASSAAPEVGSKCNLHASYQYVCAAGLGMGLCAYQSFPSSLSVDGCTLSGQQESV